MAAGSCVGFGGTPFVLNTVSKTDKNHCTNTLPDLRNTCLLNTNSLACYIVAAKLFRSPVRFSTKHTGVRRKDTKSLKVADMGSKHRMCSSDADQLATQASHGVSSNAP